MPTSQSNSVAQGLVLLADKVMGENKLARRASLGHVNFRIGSCCVRHGHKENADRRTLQWSRFVSSEDLREQFPHCHAPGRPDPKRLSRVVKNCSGFDSDDPELTATAQHDSASHRSSAKPMVETQVSRSTAVAWHASHVFRATPEANRLTADVRR